MVIFLSQREKYKIEENYKKLDGKLQVNNNITKNKNNTNNVIGSISCLRITSTDREIKFQNLLEIQKKNKKTLDEEI